MNVIPHQIYEGEALVAAEKRGEPLAYLSGALRSSLAPIQTDTESRLAALEAKEELAQRMEALRSDFGIVVPTEEEKRILIGAK